MHIPKPRGSIECCAESDACLKPHSEDHTVYGLEFPTHQPNMSYSLRFVKGGYMENSMGVIKGETRSLDYDSKTTHKVVRPIKATNLQ